MNRFLKYEKMINFIQLTFKLTRRIYRIHKIAFFVRYCIFLEYMNFFLLNLILSLNLITLFNFIINQEILFWRYCIFYFGVIVFFLINFNEKLL